MPPQVSEDAEPSEGASLPPDHRSLRGQPVWIFGYGSLIWKPGFQFTRRRVGFIRGYSRRFWQGDSYHRGNQQEPGRVVTLLEDANADTWGVAYQVQKDQLRHSLEYLNLREGVLGGYVRKTVTFYSRGSTARGRSTLALVYIATPRNPLYLGPAEAEDIAGQIVRSRGHSGHNLEYLLRLAHFMRSACPGVEDEHLFSIEAASLALEPSGERRAAPGCA
ncbi:glutathione-specific gamma-glutamylcyclotransferase 1 [Stegostoma tigrinum]|uniref:glutathione-specific gamma-glutamylcyclotransferase 1 n=1 Tax=Stegostoma tigrinum TaxID=3053191 RepID=UPI00202B156A|nr:glutathione-specific gamma-glutamylcyclotransferase 1 [Stegostoma tigrinum]